jgi:two-component system, NarL family, nitrate/nitrite response regulator NarL
VVLTGAGDGDALVSAVEAGARAVVAKNKDAEVLLDAIDRAARGEAVLPADVLDRVVHEPAEPRDPVDLQASFLSSLEREVLQLLVEGGSTYNIARQLVVTYSTARTHIQDVLTKLGCHSRIEAVALAVGHGVAHPSAS